MTVIREVLKVLNRNVSENCDDHAGGEHRLGEL